MTTKSYKVSLRSGAVITIDNVAKADKDGSGMRFYDEEGTTIASFSDGEARAHWPANAEVQEPPEVDGE